MARPNTTVCVRNRVDPISDTMVYTMGPTLIEYDPNQTIHMIDSAQESALVCGLTHDRMPMRNRHTTKAYEPHSQISRRPHLEMYNHEIMTPRKAMAVPTKPRS